VWYQPLAATAAGALPGNLPMIGSLPIGALPTTGVGGGGCRRGKSAAAAAPTNPRLVAVTVRSFNMTIPFHFGRPLSHP
jgi:hypothetical protein